MCKSDLFCGKYVQQVRPQLMIDFAKMRQNWSEADRNHTFYIAFFHSVFQACEICTKVIVFCGKYVQQVRPRIMIHFAKIWQNWSGADRNHTFYIVFSHSVFQACKICAKVIFSCGKYMHQMRPLIMIHSAKIWQNWSEAGRNHTFYIVISHTVFQACEICAKVIVFCGKYMHLMRSMSDMWRTVAHRHRHTDTLFNNFAETHCS